MDQSIEEAKYADVERWCRNQIRSGRKFLFDPVLFDATLKATSEELDFPLESLNSFFRNLYGKHIKSTTYQIKNEMQTRYIHEYVAGRSITSLAEEANFSPALFARRIIEEMTVLGKKKLSAAMKNPAEELKSIDVIKEKYRQWEDAYRNDKNLETTTRLAKEVENAVASDPLCGPASDRARHFIGIEYEIVLERGLKKLGIPFESEAKLREKGSSRTPDVLLCCPISVQVGSEWHAVCWIDSKALYGDVDTHRTVLPQAESYVHRFGPGLLLYWFGHAPVSKLDNANGDLVIVGWKIPETILWPTGESQRSPAKSLSESEANAVTAIPIEKNTAGIT